MAQAWWENALLKAEAMIACWLQFAVVVGMVDDGVHVVVLDAYGEVPRVAYVLVSNRCPWHLQSKLSREQAKGYSNHPLWIGRGHRLLAAPR